MMKTTSPESFTTFLSLLLIIFSLVTVSSSQEKCPASSQTLCKESRYSKAVHPPILHTLPGLTRSVVHPGSFALIAPDSRVVGGSAGGWSDVEVIWLIGGGMGAKFAMYLVGGGKKGRFDGMDGVMETFIYVLEGRVKVAGKEVLEAGGFVYVPPWVHIRVDFVVEDGASECKSWCVVLQRPWKRKKDVKKDYKTMVVIDHEDHVEVEKIPGEAFELQKLLPKTDSFYGFNVHLMNFQPGEYLNVKEVHYNEHGLIMLEGEGMYKLNDQYFPVTTGDVIYMAPFVPQWYGALGKTRTRYFLYKDTNTDPITNKF